MGPHSRGRFLPGFSNSCPLLSRGRREGRAPTAPVDPCAKSAKESTRVLELQVQPRHPDLPRAMVLQLIRALPGERRLLPPSPAGYACRLDATVAAPGPHDFAVRCERFRPVKDHLTPQRPS